MEAFELFAYFWHNYSHYRTTTDTCGIAKQRDLLPLFGINPDDQKNRRTFSTYLTRWLTVGPRPPHVSSKIKDAFARQKFRTELAKACGFPSSIFDAATKEEFVEALRNAGVLPDNDYLPPPVVAFSDTRGDTPDDLTLCAEEQDALDSIAQQLVQTNSAIVEWVAPFQSGASFVADQLCYANAIAQAYASVFHLYFDPCATDGRSELRELSRHLGLDPDDANADATRISAMVEKRCLVVLHGASYTTTKLVRSRSPILQFIIAVRQKKDFSDHAMLLLISASQVASTNSDEQNNTASSSLRVATGHRFAFFRYEMNRFLSLRGSVGRLHDADARLKQARWHYDQVEDIEIWPASIRLRAFFASNMENESYFDPTQGFAKLAGSIDLEKCPDIKSLVREAETYFRILRTEAGDDDKPGPRFLNWCATTLYWLTDDAVRYISSKGQNRIQPLKPDQCRAFAGDKLYDSLVRLSPSDVPGSFNYAMTLGVKAVIQDNWMQSGANAKYTRSVVHFYTAKRMFEQRGDLPLSQELPYVKGRADDDIFFLPEVIRHLMRACGNVVKRPGKKPTLSPSDYDDHDLITFSVPDPIRGKVLGCNPQEAWRFCYWVVFRRMLNGKGRQLTRRFGAYQLKLEVLQLLCGDDGYEVGHLGMPACDAPFFLNDLACALLDVGRAEEAAEVFTRLSGLASESEDHTTHCKSLLNEAMVAGVMGDFDRALRMWDEAEKLITNAKIGAESVEKLMERLHSRRAHIAHLSGDHDKAIHLYRGLERQDLRPTIRRDRALPYIRSLAERSQVDEVTGQSDLSKAIAVCISNMIRSTTASNFHEVLGFEISMAELFRRQGFLEPAESCLDQVYLDILYHGCSERTYLNFLVEAGEVLLGRENSARAYAAYLHPVILRLQTRALANERKRAKQLALRAIDLLEDQRAIHVEKGDWSEYLIAALTTPTFLEAAVAPKGADMGQGHTERVHGKNPHFSFDLIGVDEWSKRLEEPKNLRAERKFVEELPWG
ncbi:hypothetical protein ACXYMP_15880 [Aliiroseovarius sp. CAU 1755]